MLTEANIFYYKKAMANICSTCGKSFKHSSSLSRHRTNVHKDKELKCDVCQEQLSSKCSLDRHRRAKHNISGKFEYVPYVKKEDESSDTEEESEGEVELGNYNIDSNKNVYTNNVGWVETDNKEELDNNNSEESSMETGNKDIDSNENMEEDNKKDIDNGESEESVMDSEEEDDVVSIEELDYKHDLFDVVETSKEMCDRFKYCLSFVTFRIHPPPVPIRCFDMYGKWLKNLFGGMLEYFDTKYSTDPEDFVSLNIFHVDTKKSIWIGPIKRKELNVGYIETEFLKEKLTNPSGDLTVGLNCVKSKVTCPTCGHTKVSKDGIVYTDL